jgi:phosphatidylglycerophosphatase C
MGVPTIDVDELSRKLEKLLQGSEERIVAFDADGTLWQDDVGTLTFDYALARAELHPAALPGLQATLSGLGQTGARFTDSSEAAREIDRLHRAGRLGEKQMAELQVWSYAGHTEHSARALAERALASQDRDQVRHRGVARLLHLARDLGAEVWVVSASPRWVVELAVQCLGVDGSQVIGGQARIQNGQLTAELAAPLPYGPEKLRALRSAHPTARLAAAFGDSSFDLDLLGGAELAVGIGKKESLLAGLSRLPQGLHLKDPA